MHNPLVARSRAQISARGLSIERGGTTLIERLDLTVDQTSRVVIVGENGRGKSSLLAALTGELEPSSGTVARHGRIAVAEQDMPTDAARTIGDAVTFAIQDSTWAIEALDAAALALADGAPGAEDDYERALELASTLDAWDAERRITIALEALGAETDRTRPLSELSVGQRYRVRLACVLGGDAEILLLDEPTNHLDASSLDFLTEHLSSGRKGFAVVTHDRQLLRDIGETFVDLDPSEDGRARVSGGGYDAWLAQKHADRARWEQTYRDQVETELKLRDDLETARNRLVDGWRPPKGTGKHQRATRATSAVTNVKRRQAELESNLVDVPEPPLKLHLQPWRTKSTGTLISLDEVTVEHRLLVPVTLAVNSGDRLLVRGPNGTGKSTLLSVLSGSLDPTTGTAYRKLGSRVTLLAQETTIDITRSGSTSAARLYSERAEKLVSRGEISSASVVSFERLGLMGRGERGKPIRVLSLGQLRRLDLALALLSQPDVLLLDEPTNHLSIALVEELTETFSSLRCALVVSSHDRGMLRDLEEWPTLPLPVAV